jgi:hypothetical protein
MALRLFPLWNMPHLLEQPDEARGVLPAVFQQRLAQPGPLRGIGNLPQGEKRLGEKDLEDQSVKGGLERGAANR